MSPKRLTLRVGDVFSAPIQKEGVGYGQIAAPWSDSGGHFYFAIFDGVYTSSEPADLDEVVDRPLALLALSTDALLLHGHWRVVGNRQSDEDRFPWPAYKEAVSPPGTFDVVDYTGGRRCRATPAEAESLPFRTVVAPIRLENALRASNGAAPWEDAYEKLLPVADEQTSAVLLPR